MQTSNRAVRLLLACLLVLTGFFGVQTVYAETKTEAIERIVRRYHEKGQFDGALLVADRGRVVYKSAYGLANRSWNIDNGTDTRFKIASITKQFTALLVMQRVAEGRVKLDSPISTYLPDCPAEIADKITVRQLLTHTSGLPTLDDESGYYQNQAPDLLKPDRLLKTVCTGSLQQTPGTKFNYNNADFILLGLLLEKVTGKPYEQLLTEKILQPLQLKNSGLATQEAVIGKQASGYLFENGVYRNEPYFRIQNFYAAGAMYSTVDDLFVWNRALDTYRLLSREYTEAMFAPLPSLGFVALGSWAYRLELPTGEKPLLIERQGSTGGFHSLNIRVPEREASLIILSNLDTSELYNTYTKTGLPYELLAVLLAK
ncbi:serine hydrolase domain-containing protein [Gloeobacter kilaueensis]|uniref:Beta-lactamase n=1 Tax=Gloeobacter kilaueensis (strain ATCC BAA-2537 / CCAP 1431/1 / ULC 316 / JS1) TaxID=1183438 RepID=U5QNX0_GLOK1|nr:serine hydrolase domain-containing protein [Gloeobacter kilaueensis]AGY60636.1 beta-lactamase [Gloeobacter kilaueensis JS1]